MHYFLSEVLYLVLYLYYCGQAVKGLNTVDLVL